MLITVYFNRVNQGPLILPMIFRQRSYKQDVIVANGV